MFAIPTPADTLAISAGSTTYSIQAEPLSQQVNLMNVSTRIPIRSWNYTTRCFRNQKRVGSNKDKVPRCAKSYLPKSPALFVFALLPP
ncbi:hypothetical protein O9992_13075 [Vibrio lentus]|nr:hypothetical protein [Vibrio lentus]